MKKKVMFVVPPQQHSYAMNSEETKEGCQCQKTKCLKLYCQCFHEGKCCGEQCSCSGCKNSLTDNFERNKAIVKIIHKYKDESKLKFSGDKGSGCCCKKSKCQLNYCECFIKGRSCGDQCHCKKCQNGKKQNQKICANHEDQIQICQKHQAI
ncbi:unnamed protein product (macronuclear) [Paramecium tetraurelia]|uniref:CRC domain-containing protein n=1 Tax=Paramecium tetraurelia TaxID=5888 RepID=A0D8K5_PARTE|nr:uncharacterized protein GSPATT00014318001 [Paramecium tetraurelia]CAK79372.1 unnamed protein product [Paramecium tetraurelia]|eukprot:XP_001446769.1 hypothetical protein (macronuclear) [Paramecium tetraurelia strain d4-2]